MTADFLYKLKVDVSFKYHVYFQLNDESKHLKNTCLALFPHNYVATHYACVNKAHDNDIAVRHVRETGYLNANVETERKYFMILRRRRNDVTLAIKLVTNCISFICFFTYMCTL